MRLDLNVATNPPVPRAARGLAVGAVALASALCVVTGWLAFSSRALLANERAALPVEAASPAPIATPEELAVLAAVAVPAPGSTAAFAQLERDLPAGARLERVEWKAGNWTVRVVTRDEAGLRDVETALATIGRPKPLTQQWRDGGIVAVYEIRGRDA